MSKKKDREHYPVILGPEAGGRQHVLAFTADGPVSGVLADEGTAGEPDARVRVRRDFGPLGTMEVVEGEVSKGPPKVNSAAYRANWETIFGAKQEVGQA